MTLNFISFLNFLINTKNIPEYSESFLFSNENSYKI